MAPGNFKPSTRHRYKVILAL